MFSFIRKFFYSVVLVTTMARKHIIYFIHEALLIWSHIGHVNKKVKIFSKKIDFALASKKKREKIE